MKSAQHEQAFNLFYQTDFTRKQIADLLNIDRKTLFTWIKEGNWMRSKNAARQTPTLLVEQYYNQLCELNLKIAERDDMPYPTKEEAEIIRKLTAVISQYNKKKASIGETIEVLADFHEYLDRNYNGEGKYIMSFSDKYVQHRAALNDKFDFGKQYYENILRDKEYDQFLKEQADLKKDDPTDPDTTNNVIGSPVEPPPAPHTRSASLREAQPPVKNYYMGNPVPIPESRKNFGKETSDTTTPHHKSENTAPASLSPLSPEGVPPALNAESSTRATVSPAEPPVLSPDKTTPPSGGRGVSMGNSDSPENPAKPAPEATNSKTKSTKNGEFSISEKGEKPATATSATGNEQPKPKETRQEMIQRIRQEEIQRKLARLQSQKRY